MAIRYLPRSSAITLVDGIEIPASGLISGYQIPALEKHSQYTEGDNSALIKEYFEPLAEGAPEDFDTLIELANGKLTAVQAATIAEIGVTTDLVLDVPIAIELNAVFDDTEVEAALLAKADQTAVSSLVTAIEGRMDAIESKIDALIVSLKNAGIMTV